MTSSVPYYLLHDGSQRYRLTRKLEDTGNVLHFRANGKEIAFLEDDVKKALEQHPEIFVGVFRGQTHRGARINLAGLLPEEANQKSNQEVPDVPLLRLLMKDGRLHFENLSRRSTRSGLRMANLGVLDAGRPLDYRETDKFRVPTSFRLRKGVGSVLYQFDLHYGSLDGHHEDRITIATGENVRNHPELPTRFRNVLRWTRLKRKERERYEKNREAWPFAPRVTPGLLEVVSQKKLRARIQS